jgi:hypothetical protein
MKQMGFDSEGLPRLRHFKQLHAVQLHVQRAYMYRNQY